MKAFLALRVKKIGSLIAPIFGTNIKFLDEFIIILLILLSPPLITLLSLGLNAFKAHFSKDSIIFNKKVNNVLILLKS